MALPATIIGYAWRIGRAHQLRLIALTVVVFLLDLAPLELQRRIVNDALRQSQFAPLALLCGLYLAVNLAEGALKLALNVYRGWVGECAARTLRHQVIAAEERRDGRSADGEGTEIAIVVAEVDPISGIVGNIISDPLQQVGVLLSVFGYLALLQPWVAVVSFALFALQLLFVPPLQRAINRRAADRIAVLRRLGGAIAGNAHLPTIAADADIERVMALNIAIYWRKYVMNFAMNGLYHVSVTGVFLFGGWLALSGHMEYGAVVAFVSGLGRINDPWGDLVNYFRDLANAQIKYRMVRDYTESLAVLT